MAFVLHLVLALFLLVTTAGFSQSRSTGGWRKTEWFVKDSQREALFKPVQSRINSLEADAKPINQEDHTRGVPRYYKNLIPVDLGRSYNIQLDWFTASGNPMDDCWRSNSNWPLNRQGMADCAIGFGARAAGGQSGSLYVVTKDTDVDVINPAPGTLRYGVIQQEPLWIIFSQDMNIKLQNELIMNSFKTIDGRGHNIHISGGAGLNLQHISNVIIHGIYIHDIVPTGPAIIRSNSSHAGHRGMTDGDAVSIFGSQDIWIDHCHFSNATDGLIDAIMGSTFITISSNYFTQHDKVMLFGAHANDTGDRNMQITVAYNHFGPGLKERLPRVRHGSAHIVNNVYDGWGIYAIGGSENPTIVSEGNIFDASRGNDKEVTKRIDDGGSDYGSWQSWNWQSTGDRFLNGAFFVTTGNLLDSPIYTKVRSILARPVTMVGSMTRDAGPLACTRGVC